MTISLWVYSAAGGPALILGQHSHADGHDGGLLYVTESRELAQRWARDLRAARIPSEAEAGKQTDQPSLSQRSREA